MLVMVRLTRERDIYNAAGQLPITSYRTAMTAFWHTSFVALTLTPDFKQRRKSSRPMSALGQKRTFGDTTRKVCSWG